MEKREKLDIELKALNGMYDKILKKLERKIERQESKWEIYTKSRQTYNDYKML